MSQADILSQFIADGATSSASQTNVEGKIAAAKADKDKGNALIGSGDAKGALQHYHFAKLHIKGLTNVTADQKEEIKNIETSVTLNLTLVYVKLAMWDKIPAAAAFVLERDPNNVKALFRRAKANIEMGNTDKARDDLVKAIKLSPNDTLLRDEYARLQQKEEQQSKQASNVFKSFFGDYDASKKSSEQTATTGSSSSDVTSNSSKTVE